MPSLCVFQLFKKPEVYFIGEPIEGTITLITTNDKHIAGMRALLMGLGTVRYRENDRSGKADKLEVFEYAGTETYLIKILHLEDRRLLPADSYTYNIRFTLDEHCLTSCESERGYIRYEISLDVKKIKGYNNVFKYGVTVINHVNLVIEPSWKLPIQYDINDQPCGCETANSFITIKTPMVVLAPGQLLKYTLELHICPKKKIQKFAIRLLKKMTFISKSPTRTMCITKNYIVSKFLPAEKLSKRIVEDEFPIPPTPPTTLDSSIISIQYVFKVQVQVSCCSLANLVAKIPIVINTVPLKEGLSLLQNQVVAKSIRQETASLQRQELKAHATLQNPTHEVKRLRRAEVEEASDAVRLPLNHCKEESSQYLQGPESQAAANNHNLPFMGYEEQPKELEGTAARVRVYEKPMTQSEAAALNAFFMGYEKEPPKPSVTKKNKEQPNADEGKKMCLEDGKTNSPLPSYEARPTTPCVAVIKPLPHYEKQKALPSKGAPKLQDPTAANFPLAGYEKQSSQCYIPKRDNQIASPNTPLTPYEEQPSTSRAAVKGKSSAILNSPNVCYVKQALKSSQGSAGSNFPSMGYKEQLPMSQYPGPTPNLSYTNYQQQPTTSRVAQNHKAHAGAPKFPFMSYEEQLKTSQYPGSVPNLQLTGYEEQLTNLGGVKGNEQGAFYFPSMGYEEQPMTSREAKMREAKMREEAAAARGFPSICYEELQWTPQYPGSTPNLPFAGDEEQPMTSREARRRQEAAAAHCFPSRGYEQPQLAPQYPGSTPNLSLAGYEEQTMTFRVGKKHEEAAGALSYPIMGYEEQLSRSQNPCPTSNLSYTAYEKQPAKSCEAIKDKLPLMEHRDQLLTYQGPGNTKPLPAVNSPITSDVKQPTMARSEVMPKNISTGVKLPVKDCQEDLQCNSKSVARSATVFYPIEIDVLRRSKTTILPPNEDDMKPISYELEPYPEPPFIDDERIKHDRYDQFQLLYPVYGVESQAQPPLASSKIKNPRSANGYRRLKSYFISCADVK